MAVSSQNKVQDTASERTFEVHGSDHPLPDEPPKHKKHGRYVKNIVYGGLDGTITTFAVVAGVQGASLSNGIVLILGFANLLADGISMAIGDYLSTKSEQEYYLAERKREGWEIDHYFEDEKKETIRFYMEKGYSQKDATTLVSILSKKKELWIDVMLQDEIGITPSTESPLRNATVTFVSFILIGSISLLFYVLGYIYPTFLEHAFLYSSILTGLTLFILGAAKVSVTARNWFVSGFEMFCVGGFAAIVAYGIGVLLSGLA